jgi:CRP-like cAMP-binding protein
LTVKKRQSILEYGEVSDKIFFIKKGLIKCVYKVRGKPVVDWFLAEFETVVSIQSFYDQVAGTDAMIAVEDCELYYITFDELTYIFRTFVEFNVVRAVLTVKYLKLWHQQARIIRQMNKEERYKFFVETQPDIARRVGVTDLASYLDMARETLSRTIGDLNKPRRSRTSSRN